MQECVEKNASQKTQWKTTSFMNVYYDSWPNCNAHDSRK